MVSLEELKRLKKYVWGYRTGYRISDRITCRLWVYLACMWQICGSAMLDFLAL